MVHPEAPPPFVKPAGFSDSCTCTLRTRRRHPNVDLPCYPLTDISSKTRSYRRLNSHWIFRYFRFSFSQYCVPCVHSAHESGALVSSWLNRLDLGQYAETFMENEISPTVLLSLTSNELYEIGVKRLEHRRIILKELSRQQVQPNPLSLAHNTQEHGRILTHLSNDRLCLLWLRVAVIMLIVAVTAVRISGNSQSETQNVKKFITIAALFYVILAIVISLYALLRYCFYIDMSDHPAEYVHAVRLIGVTPIMFVIIITAILLHALMAHRAHDTIALIFLVSI